MAETLIAEVTASAGTVQSNGALAPINSGNATFASNTAGLGLVAGQASVSQLPPGNYRVNVLVRLKRNTGNINAINLGLQNFPNPTQMLPVQQIGTPGVYTSGDFNLTIGTSSSIQPFFRLTPPDDAAVPLKSLVMKIFRVT
jgi:hypothetical protein